MARRTDQRGTEQPALDETAGWPGDGADDAWQADHWRADHRQAAQRRDTGGVLRLLALIAVALGLAALTAAACVLSYQSIHVLADQARVSDQLARIYPLIFDALLVVSGCCVLALRGAGLPSKLYAWLCLIVLLAALAAGGVVHAAGYHMPLRPAEITAAVVPFALVLLGFGLLLALLRHSRLKRASRRPAQQPGPLTLPGLAAPPSQPALALPAYPPDAPDQPAAAATPAAGAATAAAATVAPSTGSKASAAAAPAPASGAPVTDHASTATTRPGATTTRTDATPADASPATSRPSATSTTRPGATISRPAATPADASPAATPPGAADAASRLTKPAPPDPDKPAKPAAAARPPVRQADLQLRARIPKPAPASDTPPGQAGSGPAGTPPADTGPADTRLAGTGPGATAPAADAPTGQPAPLLPPVAPGAAGLVGGQERRTSLMRFRSRKSVPAETPQAPPDTDDAATKPHVAPAELSPAPTASTADERDSSGAEGPAVTGPADSEDAPAPAEPPALERPRSSPTRPHD